MFYKVEYTEDSCASLWNIELFVLHLIGLKSVRSAFGNEKYRRDWIREWVLCTISIIVFSFSAYTCFLTLHVQGYDDISFAAENVALILSTTMCLSKGVVLTIQHRQLFDVLRTFHNLWEEAKTRTHLGPQIGKLINSSKPARYFYTFAAMSVGLSYSLRPYVILLAHYLKDTNSSVDYSVTMYPLEYPYPRNSFLTYNLCIVHEQWITYFGCLYAISCDALFIQVSTHVCIHLLVLSSDFSMEHHNGGNIRGYFTAEYVISLTQRHRHLLRLCNKVETLFNPIIFSTVLLDGLDLCCCIFTLDREISNGQWRMFARSVTHAITLLIQIVIYCDYAHRATDMTKNIAAAIYNSPWVECDKKVQKLLIISLMRANEEYKFSAYGIFNIDREQMTRIFKTTGSYVTLLRSFS